MNSNLPYSVRSIHVLQGEFEKDHPQFDMFKLLRADNLKWLELEKAIARAMTNVKDLTKTLGEAWCFLKPSFVSQSQACLTLSPQVIPQVKKNGAALSKRRLEQWVKGTREATTTNNDTEQLACLVCCTRYCPNNFACRQSEVA
eukprot:TRINITY_DN8980_c0_g1_i1.p1 TRINITY_DN8980_c0_g1~~TRINITY_DN8980_c0_g1_i1.p1  ORF type:complete len:144 (-),score=23.73 TRINITY_DN8980_c0_g1_i1:249-680(-)